MRASLFTALALSVVAAPAVADEAWQTNMGPIIWEQTMGPDAVLRLYSGDDESQVDVRMIVPGLGDDMMGGRGTYTGLWVAYDGDVACSVEMVDPLGGKSAYWGTFTLTFLEDGFPSDWAGAYGECLNPPSAPIQAHALVGEDRASAPLGE